MSIIKSIKKIFSKSKTDVERDQIEYFKVISELIKDVHRKLKMYEMNANYVYCGRYHILLIDKVESILKDIEKSLKEV